MPNVNFRLFKYVVLYAGAIAVIPGFLYWLVDVAGTVQWASENRTTWGRIWTVLTSREGVVIWTGLIAIFILATIFVERRLDANKDVKWKRRNARLDNKRGRIDRRKLLTEGQLRDLIEARRKGYELSNLCVSGKGSEQEIGLWENETAEVIRLILGDEPADRFLHAPTLPIHMGGYSAATGHRIGRMKVRMEVLGQIIADHSA